MTDIAKALIKPLEWAENPDREYHYSTLDYEVRETGLGRWTLWAFGLRVGIYPYCAEAQAAAEADYLARISATLKLDLIAGLVEAAVDLAKWCVENIPPDETLDAKLHALDRGLVPAEAKREGQMN